MERIDQLVLVVEATSALGRHWSKILQEHLLTILRSFSLRAFPGVSSTPKLALITFKARRSCSPIKNTGWTEDIGTCENWLSRVVFSDFEIPDVAFAEGLVEALGMLCNSCDGSAHAKVCKHCLLVCASDPFAVEASGGSDSGRSIPSSYTHHLDLMNCFSKLNISVSIVAPTILPIWAELYNTANSVVECFTYKADAKRSKYTLLLSEKLPGACSAPDLPLKGPVYMPGVGPADPIHVPLNSQPVTVPARGWCARNLDLSAGCSKSAGSASNALEQPVCRHSRADHSVAKYTKFDFQKLANIKTKFVLIWTGTLYGPVGGRQVVLSRFMAYTKSTAASAKSVVSDWPPLMKIVRLPTKEFLNKVKCEKNAQRLTFQVLDNHIFFNRMRKGNQCAVVRLPSQTVVLSPPSEAGLLSGVLLSGVSKEEADFYLNLS